MGDEGRSQEGQSSGESEDDGLFTVSPSYGGNPLPFPQEGGIGSGAHFHQHPGARFHPPQPREPRLRDQLCNLAKRNQQKRTRAQHVGARG